MPVYVLEPPMLREYVCADRGVVCVSSVIALDPQPLFVGDEGLDDVYVPVP